MYYVNENIKDLYRVKFHDERSSVLRQIGRAHV